MIQNRIGPALREARTAKGLSLRALAGAVGVSASQLSQIETGKSQASVSTLYELVSHLGLSLDALLQLGTDVVSGEGGTDGAGAPTVEPGAAIREQVVQAASDNPVLEMAKGVRWERLAGVPGSDVDMLRVTYQPGAASSIDQTLMRHHGMEYAYLVSGELTLLLEFDQHVIGAGESLAFDSTRPHLYVNKGDEPAVGVWFVAGGRDLAHTRDWVSSQLPAGDRRSEAPRLTNAVEVLERLRSDAGARATDTERTAGGFDATGSARGSARR